MITEDKLTKYIRVQGVINDLQTAITKILDSVGIFYRIWIRVKSFDSIKQKLDIKIHQKGIDYKMQDLIGVRIVCYFNDDISIVEDLLRKNFDEKDKDSTIDEFDSSTFKPIRRNYVYQLPEDVMNNIEPKIWEHNFDKTFEVQVRTIFAEGWHEVEHDLRYKNQSCWEDSKDLSRHLNGILATLETCDWSLSKVFIDLSYHNYKNKEWIHMIKNKLRIRMINDNPSIELNELISLNIDEISKKLFNFDRNKLLHVFSVTKLPINIDNIIYIANYLFLQNDKIIEFTPEIIKEKLKGFQS